MKVNSFVSEKIKQGKYRKIENKTFKIIITILYQWRYEGIMIEKIWKRKKIKIK